MKSYKSTALHQAIKIGDLDLLEKSLKKSDIDAIDEDGNTPLHLTIKYGRKDLFFRILREKPDPTITSDQNRHKAILFALLNDQPEMAAILRDYAVDFRREKKEWEVLNKDVIEEVMRKDAIEEIAIKKESLEDWDDSIDKKEIPENNPKITKTKQGTIIRGSFRDLS